MMTLSEENRRMQDMMKMYGMSGMDPSMFGGQETLVLNANHPLVQYLREWQESDKSLSANSLYDLAMMSHKPLSPEEMTAICKRSNEIMMHLFRVYFKNSDGLLQHPHRRRVSGSDPRRLSAEPQCPV